MKFKVNDVVMVTDSPIPLSSRYESLIGQIGVIESIIKYVPYPYIVVLQLRWSITSSCFNKDELFYIGKLE